MANEIAFGVDLAEQKNQGPKDGIYVNEGTITSAQVAYNAKFRETWSPSSIILKLEVAQEGMTWDKEVALQGNYTIEGDSIVKEGSAFKVWSFLRELRQLGHIKTSIAMNEKGQIVIDGTPLVPALGEEYVDFPQVKGAPLLFIQYVAYRRDDGKTGTRTWDRVGVQRPTDMPSEAQERLRAQFLKQVAGGYRTDYSPGLLNGASGDGATGTAPVPADTTEDDMPF